MRESYPAINSVAFLAVFMAPARAQKEDWLPITQHDLAMKQVPGNPGADAVQLYYANLIDDQDKTAEFFYHRIKILNDKGKRHADVEVIVLPGQSISGLKARTIQPDGRIVEFTGKPYEKNRNQNARSGSETLLRCPNQMAACSGQTITATCLEFCCAGRTRFSSPVSRAPVHAGKEQTLESSASGFRR